MEDFRGKFIVICAGYTDEINRFLESNPGLKSRFDRSFDFADYSENELLEILITLLESYEFKIDNEVTEELKLIINKLFTNKGKYFGNAREIRKMAEQIVRNHDLRMASLNRFARSKIDINKLESTDLKIDIPELKEKKRKIGFSISE